MCEIRKVRRSDVQALPDTEIAALRTFAEGRLAKATETGPREFWDSVVLLTLSPVEYDAAMRERFPGVYD